MTKYQPGVILHHKMNKRNSAPLEGVIISSGKFGSPNFTKVKLPDGTELIYANEEIDLFWDVVALEAED